MRTVLECIHVYNCNIQQIRAEFKYEVGDAEFIRKSRFNKYTDIASNDRRTYNIIIEKIELHAFKQYTTFTKVFPIYLKSMIHTYVVCTNIDYMTINAHRLQYRVQHPFVCTKQNRIVLYLFSFVQ